MWDCVGNAEVMVWVKAQVVLGRCVRGLGVVMGGLVAWVAVGGGVGMSYM
jgi:hypothetical protein